MNSKAARLLCTERVASVNNVKSLESALNALIDEVNRYGVVPELERFRDMCPAEHGDEFRELAAVFLAIKMVGASHGSGQLRDLQIRRSVDKALSAAVKTGDLSSVERARHLGRAANFRAGDLARDANRRVREKLDEFVQELMEEDSDDET